MSTGDEIVKVRELLDEGLDILNGIVDSVKRRGNYSAESTCVYIGQAGQCFREALSALTPAPVRAEGEATDKRLLLAAKILLQHVENSPEAIDAGGWLADCRKDIESAALKAEDSLHG